MALRSTCQIHVENEAFKSEVSVVANLAHMWDPSIITNTFKNSTSCDVSSCFLVQSSSRMQLSTTNEPEIMFIQMGSLIPSSISLYQTWSGQHPNKLKWPRKVETAEVTYSENSSRALTARWRENFPLSLLPGGQYTRTLTPVGRFHNWWKNTIEVHI